MNRMAQTARYLAAVVLLVTAVVMPALVQAHPGHAPDVRQTDSVRQTRSGPESALTLRSDAVHASDRDLDRSPARQSAEAPELPRASADTAAEVWAASSAQSGDGGDTGWCSGKCCGVGVSCCAAWIVGDDPSTTLAGVLRSSRLALPAEPIAAGLDPMALRKPPKSLA